MNDKIIIENTVRLKAARDQKSVSAGSEFHTVKILHDENFRRILQEFCDTGMYSL